MRNDSQVKLDIVLDIVVNKYGKSICFPFKPKIDTLPELDVPVVTMDFIAESIRSVFPELVEDKSHGIMILYDILPTRDDFLAFRGLELWHHLEDGSSRSLAVSVIHSFPIDIPFGTTTVQ